MTSQHHRMSAEPRTASAGLAKGKELIREIAFTELGPRTVRRAELGALHNFWVQHGLARWMSLLEPESRRPLVIMQGRPRLESQLCAVCRVSPIVGGTNVTSGPKAPPKVRARLGPIFMRFSPGLS